MNYTCPVGVIICKIFLSTLSHFSPKNPAQLSQREEETMEVISHNLLPFDSCPSGSEIFNYLNPVYQAKLNL